ncbi:MAG: PEP-CTERM sorting domain-containing protein [Sideroxyarcus sp.]|nr:PEP-CTERM sorting domain-containing protein [Sideroxyarcus sp.]
MKRIALSLLLASLCGVAQAGSLVATISVPAITFSGYDGQPLGVTGAQNHGNWGWLSTTSAGTFYATYLGQESGYVNSFSFGSGNGTLLESNALGTTISQSVGNDGIVNFSFSDNQSASHVFSNRDQGNPFGFVIMAGQSSTYSQFGRFDYLLGFNDSWVQGFSGNTVGDADYDDFVVGVNFVSAPVPEPETYAMMFAGLGLLGLSVRRRKSHTFD